MEMRLLGRKEVMCSMMPRRIRLTLRVGTLLLVSLTIEPP